MHVQARTDHAQHRPAAASSVGAPAIATRLLLLAVLSAASPAHAAWPGHGVPAGDGSGDQRPGHTVLTSLGRAVAPDGDGGMLVAFRDQSDDIRINRLDAVDGSKLWGASGISILGNLGSTASAPHVLPDGNGGMWIVWVDARAAAPGLYLQRVNSAGAATFALGGIRISDGGIASLGDDDFDAEIAANGNVTVAFWDFGLRVQQVTPAGALLFGTAGTAVTTDGPRRVDLVTVPNGALVTWESNRNGQAGLVSIFANRVDDAGVAQWGPEGTLVLSSANVIPHLTRAATDGTNLFVAWAHHDPVTRPDFSDVHVQKMSSIGTRQWGPLGITVLLAPDTAWDFFSSADQTQPQVIADGSGGCIVTWVDYRDFSQPLGGFTSAQDIYGQRVGSTGIVQWTANGEPLETAPGTQSELQMIPDGAGGAFLGYKFTFADPDVMLRRIDDAGVLLWASFVTNLPGTQTFPTIGPDDSGGVLIAWSDARNDPPDGTDCYAAHQAAAGTPFDAFIDITSPAGGEVIVGSTQQTIEWTSNVGGNVRIEYSLDGGPRQLISPSAPNDGLHPWNVPNVSSTDVRVFVSDTDGSPADSTDAFSTCAPLTLAGTFAAGDAPEDLVAADFDEDGIIDLAIIRQSSDSVAVLLGNGASGTGDGTFKYSADYAVGSSPRQVLAEDFDEDGILDLAVTATDGVRVLPGLGSGSIGNGTFGSPSVFPAGVNPAGLVPGDFNSDGILDLAVANGASDSVSILLGNGASGTGDGTFAAPVNYAVGDAPVRLAAADFNEDGVLDLAVVNNGAVSNSVSILLGNGSNFSGDGTFAPHVEYAVAANPWDVATGFFNGDSYLDLVVSNVNGNTVSLLLGNGAGVIGDGTFVAPISWLAGTAPRDLVAADLTGDGLLDVAVVNRAFDEVTVLQGVSNGTLSMLGSWSVSGEPAGIVAADFNGDGTPDLATANHTTQNASVLLGDCAEPGAALLVISPNGGESMTIGTPVLIQLASGSFGGRFNIELSRDGGTVWETLAWNHPNARFNWNPTEPPTSQALIRVVDASVHTRADTSDATFVINATVSTSAPVYAVASLTPPVPNPSRGTVRFGLSIPEAVSGEVAIYDLAGRRVITLAGGRLAQGPHALVWDGRTAGGRRTPAGVYFVRARWEGFEAVRRIVRIE